MKGALELVAWGTFGIIVLHWVLSKVEVGGPTYEQMEFDVDPSLSGDDPIAGDWERMWREVFDIVEAT